MKFPNYANSGRNRAFFLIFLCLTATLVLSIASKKSLQTQKEDLDLIRCSSLSSSINAYIGSLSSLNLCGGAGCETSDVYETFVVTYYVDAYKEVDFDDVINQIMVGIQNGDHLPCACLSLHTKGSISCTTGYHNLSITLKYCEHCPNN